MNLRKCIVTFFSIVLGIVLVLDLVWVFITPHLLNRFLNSQVIEHELKSKSNSIATVSKLNFKLYPDFSINIRADKVNIRQNNVTVIDTSNLDTRISIIPLVFSNLSVKKLDIESITLKIIRDKEGKTNLEEILLSLINTKTNLDIKKLNVNIEKYDISYLDKTINYNMQVKGDYFYINEFVSNKKINLNTNGEIIYPKTSSTNPIFNIDITSELPIKKNLTKNNFSFNLGIQNLDLSAFSPLMQYIKATEIIGLSGKINAEIKTVSNDDEKKIVGKIQSEDFSICEKLPENSTYLREKATIDFNTNLLKNTLILNNFKLKTIHHDLQVNGQVNQINSNTPQLDLKVKLHNDEKSMIYTLVPSEIDFENRMIAKIKKYRPKATVDGEITIKGDALEPDIEGEFHTDNLFIDLPVANEAKAKLKLIFLKKKLRVLADVVPNKGTFVKVDGICDLYGAKSAIFDINSGKNVKLTVTRAVLMPIQDTFSLNFGILNHLFVEKGLGDATLHIDGTRTDARVDGKLNFYSGTASLEGLNTKVENIYGFLNFRDKTAKFETTKSTINNDNIKISGTADLYGAYNINLVSNSIKTNTLLNLLKTSEMLKPAIKELKELNLIKSIEGYSKIKLSAKGKMDDMKALVNISDVDYNGEISLKNNLAQIKGFDFPIKILTANAGFTPKSINAKTNTQIINSKIDADAQINGNNVKVYAVSKRFLLRDLIIIADKTGLHKKIFATTPPKNTTCVKFNALYNNKTRDIDLNKLKLNAEIFYDKTSSNTPKVYATQGQVTLQNGNANVKRLYLTILDSVISINGTINNVFDKKPDYNLDCSLKNFDLANLNNFGEYKIFGEGIKKILNAYGDYKGNINGWLKLRKSSINGKLQIRNISFIHKKTQMPFAISNADVIFKNNSLSLNSLSATVDDVPVFLTLKTDNITTKPQLKGYITSNVYPTFINKYVNANLGYPIKLKGETRIKSYFQGNFNNLKSSTIIDFPTGSNISYMGASLDDEDFDREIKIDLIQSKNNINVLNASYSKYIPSQDGSLTKYPYISANGKITIAPPMAIFNNFKIKTHAKTSSKFFNILFKKSVLKYGDFECDLNINGTISAPKILGFIKFRNLDMPLYETVIKDIFADFTKNTIALKVLGNVYDTNISAMATLDNKLTAPYKIKNVDIKADYLNLDTIFDSMSKVTMQSPHAPKTPSNNDLLEYIEPSNLLVDNGVVSAKKILIKGFPATDLEANFRQGTDKVLRINNFDFTIADGTISANGYYDFKNNLISGDCIAKSIDANQFSQIFLNVKNQIFGALNGTVSFTTNGTDQLERIKNLDCKVSFLIQDGKMPKLGSLEYLLRAGNVIKSGITGFTINNIIELLVPIKTGDFSVIRGNILVSNGIANDIKLYSKGKNLSLYITGSGNLLNQNSQMIVYGRLSKKVSTLLGPIGNTSLNTLFNLIPGVKLTEAESSVLKDINKIPGLEFSSDEYRFFSAEIDGDINGENYVKSFKWLE